MKLTLDPHDTVKACQEDQGRTEGFEVNPECLEGVQRAPAGSFLRLQFGGGMSLMKESETPR